MADIFSDTSDPSTRPKVTGTCNCGRYKYTIPKAEKMNLCHCLDCRKWAGAMHSAHLFVQNATIDDHGSPAPKTWTTRGESGGEMTRAWCDECGAGLWLKTGMKPDMTFLKAGLFQPDDIPNPTMENWLRNKQPWENLASGTQRQADGN